MTVSFGIILFFFYMSQKYFFYICYQITPPDLDYINFKIYFSPYNLHSEIQENVSRSTAFPLLLVSLRNRRRNEQERKGKVREKKKIGGVSTAERDDCSALIHPRKNNNE